MREFSCVLFANNKKITSTLHSLFTLVYLPLLFIIAFAVFSAPVFADGVSWLESQVNENGSYENPSDVSFDIQSTSEVLSAYHELEKEDEAGVTNARALLDSHSDLKTEILSRKIIAKAEAGGDVSTLLAKLVQLQNRDGGFGDQSGYQSRVIDTSFALNALGIAQSNSSETISSAVAYLLSEQSSDGGFSHSSANQNSIYETALASIALQNFRFNFNLTAAIDGATNYLLNNQRSAGDWGSTWESAQALLALIPVTSDVQSYQPGVDFLKTAQAVDGSWDQDVYATALALRAIHKAENVQIPEDPTTGTYTGQIFNAENGQPLPGSIIKLTDIDGFETTSSVDGSFSLEGISPGEHTLSYSAPGFSSATQTATIVVGKFTSLGTIQLTPLPDKGVLFGIVKDAETSQPLPSVTINISGSTAVSVTTNAEGYYSIEVEPGQVSLATQIDGYDAITANTEVIAGQRLNFSPLLNLAGTTPEVTTVKTKVTVVDANTNLPIEGAVVSITGSAISGTTNNEGKLILDNIAAGSLTIDISATGYQAVSANTIAPAGSVIDLGVVSLLKTEVTTKRSVKGFVTDAVSGNAIAGANVKVAGTNISVITNSEGYYLVEDTGLAAFTLVSSAVGYLENRGEVNIDQPGQINVNIQLVQAQISKVNITAVPTSQTNYAANSEVEIEAEITNEDSVDRNIRLFIVIVNAEGVVVEQFPSKVIPLGGNSNDAIETIPASSIRDIELEWLTGLNPPGVYQIKVQAIDASTNQLLSEKAAQVEIDETIRIGGGASFDPPIVQRVANNQVKVEAIVQNDGNQLLPAGNLTATVTLEIQGNERSTTFGEVTTSGELDLSTTARKMDADQQGNLYIADQGGKKILQVDSNGDTKNLLEIANVAPVDVDVDESGTIFIVDTGGDIFKYNPQTGISEKTHDSNVSRPSSLEVLSDGRILVGTVSLGVFEIAIDGTVTNIQKSGMAQPQDLLKDSQGAAYISDNSGVIFKYDNGILSRFISEGLQQPRGMAIDASDNIYVANYGLSQVLKITPDKEVSVYADDLNNPWGLSFDQTGRLLVSSYSGHEIFAINIDGSKSVIIEQTVNGPDHVVHANDGSIYVMDSVRNLVKFDSQGNKQSLFNIGLSSITDMLFESDQRILVTRGNALYSVSGLDGAKETVSSTVANITAVSKSSDGDGYLYSDRYGNITKLLDDDSKLPLLQPAFSTPQTMAIHTNGDKFILNTTYVTKIAANGQVSRLAEGLQNTRDMQIDSSGNVFVIEYYKKRIIKIDSNGVVTEIAQLDFYPQKLAINSDGSFYVLKNDNRTIFKVSSTGEAAEFTTSTNIVYGMTVAIDSMLWLHHRGYSKVSMVDSDGVLNSFSFYYPTALFPASQGGVFATSYTRGLNHIANDGTVTEVLANSLSNIFAKSLIKDGDNYWLLQNDNRLVEVDSNGNIEGTYASTSNIVDFELYDDGSLIIADTSNILKLTSFDVLPTVLKSGSYTKLNKLNDNEILISTRTGIQKLNINTASSSTFVNGFSRLTGFSLSPDRSAFATTDATSNEVGFYTAEGTKQLGHIGLVNPKALLVTDNGKLLVSNAKPNKLMEVIGSSNLSVFSDISSVTHLNNLINGKISASTTSYLNRLLPTGQLEKRVSSLRSVKSSLVPDGSGWLAVADQNKLFRINADESTQILAAGIGNIADIEADSLGTIYYLDTSRKTIFSDLNSGLSLISSDIVGGVSFSFDDDDGLYIIETTTQLSHLNLGTLTKSSISSAPLIYGLSGVVITNGEIKAIGQDQTTRKGILYTIGADNSGGTIESGTVVYAHSVPIEASVAGSQSNTFDFGTFVPPVSGDYKVVVRHSDGSVLGALKNSLHVGGAALGNIALAKNQVFPGDRVVSGTISITGADSTSVTKLEPENVVLAASSGAQGRAIASDSAGNIYAAGRSNIVKVTTDGTVSTFVSNVTVGNGLTVDAAENIYAASGRNVLKITPEAQVSTLASFSSTVYAVAIDYHNQLFAVTQQGELVKINPDGTSEIVMSGIQSPRSLSIDAFDNFYVLTSQSQILRLNPERNAKAIAYHEPGLYFEFEGVNVIADCSNNLLFAPTAMPSVQFSGEERIIAQVTGNTGEARQIFYGPDIDPALADMDVLFYDRFNDRVLVWTDLGAGKVFAFPVSCGGVDVEAHIVASDTVDVNGFDPAPTRTETLDDGSTKYIWVLSEVDNRGTGIQYSAQFDGMSEGERRKVFKDAYLLFTNSFVEGEQVKTPLFIPDLLAKSESGLTVATDKPSYIENEDVEIALAVQNQNDAVLNGTIKLEVQDLSGTVVETLADLAVTDVPALGEITLNTAWNTALNLKGDYKVVANLLSQTGLTLQTTQASFSVQSSVTGNDPLARLRLTVDKPVYNTSDQVTIGSLSRNITANALIDSAKIIIRVLNPDATLNAEIEQTVGDLSSGNIRQLNSIQALNFVPEGNYTVTGELLDADQNVLANAQTQFVVAEERSLTIEGQVQVSQQSIYAGASQSCLNTIENNGSLSLDGGVFRQVLVNVDTASETLFSDQEVTVIASGDQYQFTTNIESGTLDQGQYSCILQRQEGSEWQTLAYQLFKVDMVSMSAGLNASEYPANTSVDITLTVNNPTDVDFAGNVKLTVMDGNSQVVNELSEVPAGVQANKSINLSANWDTGTTLEGDYKIVASLLNSSDQSIELYSLPFKITSIISASLELSIENEKYLSGENIKISNEIKNTTLNALLINGTLKSIIKNASGTVVYTKETALSTLASNASQSVPLEFVLPAGSTLGTYSVESQVVSGADQLAVLTRMFDVVALGASLTLETDKSSYLAEDVVKISQKITNTTTDKPLANATLKTEVKDASGTVVFSKETALSTLASNASQSVPLEFVLPAGSTLGTYSVESQVVSGADQLAVLTRMFDVVALGASLTLETDKSSYLAEDAVKISQEITNTTADKPLKNATLKTVTKNPAGVVVYSQDRALDILAPSVKKTVNLDFLLPIDSVTGIYSIESEIVKGSGLLAVITRTFVVIEVEINATLVVETDKPIYLPDEKVMLSSLVKNTSPTAKLENAVLKTIVRDSLGSVIFTKQTNLNSLNSNAIQTVDLEFVLSSDVPLGIFIVTSEIVDSEGVSLADTESRFKVEADASEAILGKVSVLDENITLGESQQCISRIKNTSDTDISDLAIRQIVTPVGSTEEIAHSDTSIILNKKSVTELVYSLDGLSLDVGNYQCVLQAQILGVYTTLDTSIFNVSDDEPTQEVTIKVSTDKLEYEQGDQVSLSNTIQNITPDIPLENATLHISVTNSEGATVFEENRALDVLSARSAALQRQAILAARTDQSITFNFNLEPDAVIGDYSVTAQVINEIGTVVATDSTTFKVIAAVAPIPTLSEWSLLLLILSLGMSVFWIRRTSTIQLTNNKLRK